MSITRRLGVCIGALAICAVMMVAPVAAQPVPLFPAQLSGANIDALFGQDNSPEAVETEIPLPGINGKAVLQSRVIRAASGSRAEGRFAYEYRIDLSQATTFVDSSCVTNLTVKFGPIEKLPYAAGAPGVALRDVYAIKQGVPANQVGFSSAVQDRRFRDIHVRAASLRGRREEPRRYHLRLRARIARCAGSRRQRPD